MTKRDAVPARYLLDVNILIALTRADHVHHHRAHEWFSDIASWATAAVTESSYLRLMLNPRVAGTTYRTIDILATLRGLRALPGHQFISDGTTLADAAIDVTTLIGTKQVTDFHLVNLAATSGVILATFDGRLKNSLAPADRHYVHVIA
ncbi:MAG: VapC toxin family PIN domain ribonuclease [Gordonia sp.]|nr:VapC toxin family PIN domain ribonuclease [Gordonia sp. (in: high G+C Gram-positive bacteria)]